MFHPGLQNGLKWYSGPEDITPIFRKNYSLPIKPTPQMAHIPIIIRIFGHTYKEKANPDKKQQYPQAVPA
jgi:hypothetical protein